MRELIIYMEFTESYLVDSIMINNLKFVLY